MLDVCELYVTGWIFFSWACVLFREPADALSFWQTVLHLFRWEPAVFARCRGGDQAWRFKDTESSLSSVTSLWLRNPLGSRPLSFEPKVSKHAVSVKTFHICCKASLSRVLDIVLGCFLNRSVREPESNKCLEMEYNENRVRFWVSLPTFLRVSIVHVCSLWRDSSSWTVCPLLSFFITDQWELLRRQNQHEVRVPAIPDGLQWFLQCLLNNRQKGCSLF